MSDGARKGLAVGCVLLAAISLLAGVRDSNAVIMIAGPVVFLSAALFFWRRVRGSATPGL